MTDLNSPLRNSLTVSGFITKTDLSRLLNTRQIFFKNLFCKYKFDSVYIIKNHFLSKHQ